MKNYKEIEKVANRHFGSWSGHCIGCPINNGVGYRENCSLCKMCRKSYILGYEKAQKDMAREKV